MKKILTMLTALAFLCGKEAKAQYPCVNGISTNPLNPINNQLPSKRNTFFNWQDSIYQVQPINNDCIRGSQMESPFYKIDNLEALRESKDMKWEDGWELIRRGFGLTDQNTYTVDPAPNAYLILYNKYTGILRVLLKTCRGADYNAAKITISFDASSQIKTDLLELSRGAVSALDKKFSNTAFAAGSKYVNDNTKWFYADFPMTYDPCTCIYKSKLNIVSQLVSTSQINIEGTINGDIYTQNVGGKAQIQKPGSIGWKDISGFVNGKLSTAHSSINNFVTQSQQFAENIGKIDTANKKSALDNLGNILKNNQFLKAGLNAVPWLKSAMSIVDIFIGGGKNAGPQEVKLLPLAVNLTAKLSGNITLVNQYHDIIFTSPGSKDAQLDPDAYPYYNEVLGVFNLIKTPVIFRRNDLKACIETRSYPPTSINSFRFDADSFHYVLNPAADMTIVNMKAAIMVSARPGSTTYIDTTNMTGKSLNNYFPFFEGKDAVNGTYNFRTDYFDMTCLDRQILKYVKRRTVCSGEDGETWWDIRFDTMYLKLMINLKRNNATATTQNVLMVLTYPMKVVTDATLTNTPTFPSCDSTILAPASASFVNAFCNSNVYYNLDRMSRVYLDSITVERNMEKTGIGLFPNPNNGIFTVKIKEQNSTLQKIEVFDLSGQRLYTASMGNVLLSQGFTKQLSINLKPGTYILTATTSKKQLKSKFMVLK